MHRKGNSMDSSGNVFADIGLPNAEQELLKAKLTILGQNGNVTVKPALRKSVGHLTVQVGG